MSNYVVTARKWRPMVFGDVVGQRHITTTLRNALATQRLAHAYLFSGPRGVGKTTTARLLAKAVNCRSPNDLNPDNTCDHCKEITEGRSFDVLEIDGASNRGVEEIRNLREAVRYAPSKGKYRIYIIDEVHMLTKEAFNALLKTLEEPPAHVMFIFATTEIQKVPATILSRCQRFDFRRITVGEIMENLKGIASAEKIEIDDDALLVIAKRGDGSLRDAQSIFDQVVSLCGKTVTAPQILEALHIVEQDFFFRVTDLMKEKDGRGAIALVDELMSRGHDIREFLSGLIEHFRNILVVKETGSTDLLDASDLHRKRYTEDTALFTVADLLRFQRFLSVTESTIRWTSQPRFKLEADLVQLVTMQRAPEVAEVLEYIQQLKKNSPDVSISSERLERPPPREKNRSGTRAVPQEPVPPAVPAPLTPAVISEQEVRSRWDEFIREVRIRRISLGSVLETSRFRSVEGNTIVIGCPAEFQLSSIKRNHEALAKIFESLFHVTVRIQAALDSQQQKEGGSEETAAESSPDSEHPVIAALRRELGAEPLQ
ncbi:MAG: DNA polymerase III subunit gamma/tau [Bacteroidetes bacterium]|nr:DNA polymerase III subunit gamma/tau [Bacteroidota bacterium]